jgi:hypothetical protein
LILILRPKEGFRREVERELTGREEEPAELDLLAVADKNRYGFTITHGLSHIKRSFGGA